MRVSTADVDRKLRLVGYVCEGRGVYCRSAYARKTSCQARVLSIPLV
jgi:hypothetical protein